jgi:hypothetical protein
VTLLRRYRSSDLTGFANLEQIISEAFFAVSEEVKSAASYALGSIAIGNLQQYLPFILTEDEEEPRRQYLLLHSLKEVSVIKKNLLIVFLYKLKLMFCLFKGHCMFVVDSGRYPAAVAFRPRNLGHPLQALRERRRRHKKCGL